MVVESRPMKTPSSRHGVAAVFTAMGLLLNPASLLADTSAEIFARHRDAVLSADHTVAEGMVFCVGRAVEGERQGASVGFGKARALGWGILDRWLFETADWPEDASKDIRKSAWSLLSPRNVSGGVVVFENRLESGHCLVVLAVPETAAVAARPDPDVLKAAVSEARKRLEGCENSPTPSRPVPDSDSSVSEPQGMWKKDGVTVNETMSKGQF